jgi:RNA polymerase sigma-70 factor (ECF subfamily)
MDAAAHRAAVKEASRDATVAHSFEALYSQHFDFVWRSLRRLGVAPSLVEDAIQDTYIILHRRLGDLRPDASAKAFLFGIALRVAHDYRRTARRKGADRLDLDSAISKEAGPFERTAKAEAVRLIERFLESLDDEKRAVFALAELEGMTAPEISDALSVNLNTVYSRLRVSREHFVAFVAAEGTRHG